jgi:hypothetical protein
MWAAAGLVMGAALGVVAEDQNFTYAVDTCMSERGYRRSRA